MKTRYAPIAESERIFLVRSLETGERGILVTAPIKLSTREKWSWQLGRVKQLRNRRRRSETPNRF